MPQLLLQQINLLLLPINGAVEFLERIFAQTGLDFEFG